jgi:hypothetical protein
MRAHFFDIDTIISSDAKVWIVDKRYPSQCVLKITQSDFNLIKKGIYRSHGNKIAFAGNDYFVSDDIMGRLNSNAKSLKADTSNLAFSMREFLDEDLIDTTNHSLNIENLFHLKNTQDDVYVICARNIKENYERMISKIEDKLRDLGIKIKKFYYISETFYERDEDETSYDKARLLVQHLIGYKTDGGVISDEEISRYDDICFYDDDSDTIKTAGQINDILKVILTSADVALVEKIKSDVKSRKPELELCLVTPNKMNRFVRTKVSLDLNNVIKSFESYKRLF